MNAESLYEAIRSALANGEPLTRGREHERVPLDGAQSMVDFCSSLQVACSSVPPRTRSA